MQSEEEMRKQRDRLSKLIENHYAENKTYERAGGMMAACHTLTWALDDEPTPSVTPVHAFGGIDADSN